MTKRKALFGYIEGYYGNLLSFEERHLIMNHLAALGMNGYLYAPKEDRRHRFNWREAYDKPWHDSWQFLAAKAATSGITLIAGIAPGLDFNFADSDDFNILVSKTRSLITDNAAIPCLLMDDIAPTHIKGFANEGAAHADLANRLADALGQEIMTTPRVYADELAHDDTDYLPHFAEKIDTAHMIFTCGRFIVDAGVITPQDIAIVKAGISPDRLVIWDNLYANDYCPRRLFTGAWQGREAALDLCGGVMLNPTGLIETDRLLLTMMAKGRNSETRRDVLDAHGVPAIFDQITHIFNLPDSKTYQPNTPATMLDALDALLWRWKSPLAREWYPWLMGLRQDCLLACGTMDKVRFSKVYPPVLGGLIAKRIPTKEIADD